MGQTPRREAEERVLAALPGWVDALSQLNRLIAERMGVTASDLSCLHVLNQQGPATAAELAGKVGLTPGSVSRMLDRLDAAGLIKRTPKDRRRVLIEPTGDGLARIAAYYAGLTARSHDDLAVFSPEELNALVTFIERAEHSAAGELARLRQPSSPHRGDSSDRA